jgi:single-strand DNA-binding protein
MNVVILRGRLTRPPEEQVLRSGDRVTTYDVRTESSAHGAETVPVVSGASPGTAAFDAGDEIVVTGRVRRRFYRAGGVTQSRTEVVADAVVAAVDGRRARRAVDAAVRLATGPPPRSTGGGEKAHGTMESRPARSPRVGQREGARRGHPGHAR